MGKRKGLRVTSTSISEPEPVEDHGEDNVEDHEAYETQNQYTSRMQCRMAKNSKKNQNSNGEDNMYLKIREMNIEKNQQRLRDLGLKNIVNSMTSLAQSHQMKKKTVTQKTHAGDVDYIPDPSDDSEEDSQQLATSVVSKKQNRRRYVSPMSMSRVANLTKIRRVVAPNAPQGNRVHVEVDAVNQDYDYEDVDDMLHTNNQREIQITDHDNSEDEENLQGREKQKASLSYSKGDSIGRCKRLRITSTVSDERIEDHIEDDHVEDHRDLETPSHQTNKIQGDSKNVRGYTQKAETWKMDSTKRVVVTFNKFGMPVGDEGNELVQFLGTLVRMPDHVSIEYSDWRKVPIQSKVDMYTIVKSKFVFHPSETSQIKKWILYSMGRKWKAWKNSLKGRAYDPSLTVDKIVSKEVKKDKRLNPTQFKKLVTSWFTPEYQRTCDAKRLSRSKMKEPHVSGTKSFARLAHEMATKNNGVYPTRGELYIKAHTRKDGTIVDDKAAHVVASLKDIANDSTIMPGDPEDFTKDDYSRVKGPEKRGYVRLVGRMPATKSNEVSSTESQTIDQLKSVVNAMAVIIQEHIPTANLSSVLSNMNIQVPVVGSLDHNNSLSIGEMTSSRIHNDNGQERRLNN